ncbi:MAG TPA: FkbM family methyltransferase [Burkholderiales bacterium]|jgi:FkbM family methyltransferase|nr:FkbM family methyltransferase [Burkholderiales bacterium]
MHPLLFKLKRLYRKEKLPDPFAYLHKWFDRIPAGVFQVGASSGGEIKGFIAQGVKTGIFVEPLPDAFQQLKEATSAQPGYFPVRALCLDVVGRKCEFHVSSSGGASSSTLKPSGHLTVHPEVKFDAQPLTLESTTVDQIVTDVKNQGRADVVAPIDLLYLDTQGAELSVLKGATRFLRQVHYIFTEVSRGGLYENDVNHMTLTEYLDSQGFSLAFLYLNRHGWGDALYIENSIFAK